MSRRPWPLVLLALCQLLSPLATVFFNASWRHVSPRFAFFWMIDQPPLRVFESLLLMPIAGLAIWRMRPWSYAIFFIALLWSLGANLRGGAVFTHAGALPATALPGVIAVYIVQGALGAYFLLPSVRAVFFNPRLRWWETKPRYEVDLNATLIAPGEAGSSTAVKLLNLSEGGGLLDAPADLAFNGDDAYRLDLELLGRPFSAYGLVAHAQKLGDRQRVGLQFIHSRDTKARFKALARALAAIGMQPRNPPLPMTQDFLRWASAAIRQGKGWVPELNPNRPFAAKSSRSSGD